MNQFISALLVAAACAVTPSVHAQYYASAATGTGTINVECAGHTSCDKTDRAHRFVAGYRFAGGPSLELGLIDFGRGTIRDSGQVAEITTGGVMAGVAFDGPVTSAFGLSTRAGVVRLKTELQIFSISAIGQSDSNVAPYLGVGIYITPLRDMRFELGVDFSRAKVNGERGDVRAALLGVRALF